MNIKKAAYWTACKILKDFYESEDVVQDAVIKDVYIMGNKEKKQNTKTIEC